MTLEVDGTFANPIVWVAMAIWSGALLLVLVPIAVRIGRRRSIERPALWAIGIAVLLVVPTQAARVLIGTWLYRLENTSVISVGFWGGSAPISVPLLVACICLACYRLAADRRLTSH